MHGVGGFHVALGGVDRRRVNKNLKFLIRKIESIDNFVTGNTNKRGHNTKKIEKELKNFKTRKEKKK